MNDEIPIRVMESDTPETNAKERPIWPPNTNGEMFMVPSDFARKLERERDEARSVANELANIASHCLGWHDHESTETAEKITNALKRWHNLKTQ
jgi:hypothetical protein